MTNSEDTSTGDNLSAINSATKVTDSFTSGCSSAHPNQLVGDTPKTQLVDNATINGDGDDWNGSDDVPVHPHRYEEPVYRTNSTAVQDAAAAAAGGELQQPDTNIQASTLPFRLIFGEKLEYKCDTTEGVLALTNYRLFIQGKNINFNIPLGVIEQVENRDIFYLHVSGKDAKCVRCTFPNNETATETMKRIQLAISSLKRMEDAFAYTFFEECKKEPSEDLKAQLGLDLPAFPSAKERFDMEIKRMEFNVQGPWRISDENKNHELCGSYPTHIIVPSNMTKEMLKQVACFRSARRFPAVVWRHRGNGAVISRCSQPEVGWFGWRSAEDEELVQNIVIACADNSKMAGQNPESTTFKSERIRMDSETGDDASSTDTHNGSLMSMELVPEPPNVKKLLILDARSYTTAVANRARGGGCECLEYYPRCEIQFMNLANIHSIRKSFMNVRQLCAMASDQSNSWYSQLESCKWLQHMSGLMKAAATVVTAIEEEGRPVMVHCSDGWDRTPQIVALAEILLDPYYRSLEGFQVLVEREWLDFGHKFADRCGQPLGSEDVNERCPVFLQWLDCLHQLIRQFPTAFEFNLTFLVKLAQHTYSNLFGTFLCNTSQERGIHKIDQRTHSVWRFLRAPANASKFRNNLYLNCDKALWPSCEVRDLVLWSQVYLGYENPPSQTTEILNPSQESSPAPSVADDMNDRMAVRPLNKCKTRSCEDLYAPHTGGLQRRQSDPNLSDSFHAGDTCDVESDDGVPMSASTPIKSIAENSEIQNISGYTADDSSTGIGRLTDFEDSENDDTEPNSESKSESTVVSISRLDPKSVESSTDTLVPDTNPPQQDTTDSKIIMRGGGGGGGGERVPKTDVTRAREHYPGKQGRKTESVNDSACSGGLADSCSATRRKIESAMESSSSASSSSRQLPPTLLPAEDVNNLSSRPKTKIEAGAVISESGAVAVVSEPENGITEPLLPVQCEVCATSRRLLGDVLSHSVHGGGGVNSSPSNNNLASSVIAPSTTACNVVAGGSGNASKFSSYNTPMHSRTPSTGVPATPDDNGAQLKVDKQFQDILGNAAAARSAFDVDGLSSLHDEVQSRLNMIVSGYRNQIENLQKELQMTRDALMKQVCHKCTHHNADRPDDAASVGDSLASAEHQSVGHESQSSEISWEAVDEKDTQPPLWLPDYAVTHCMGCEASFWLGRRKHHCRSCGKIFCADCSDQTITIPSEQFFTPVRVCETCFMRLASHSSENVPGPPNGCGLLNGNHLATASSAVLDEPSPSSSSTLPLQQNNSHNHHHNIQYANQNGCDHSKYSSSSSSSGCSHHHQSSVVMLDQSCSCNQNHSSTSTSTTNITTVPLPSSTTLKDCNHHSSRKVVHSSYHTQNSASSPHAIAAVANNCANHVNLPKNPSCKQQHHHHHLHQQSPQVHAHASAPNHNDVSASASRVTSKRD